MRWLAGVVLLTALGLAALGTPASAGPAQDMIANLARKAEPILNDRALAPADRADSLQRLLEGALDSEQMAMSLLGRYWRRAKPDQRTELTRLLETYLIDAYAARVDSLNGKVGFSVVGERALGQRTMVDTRVQRPTGPDVAVSWQVEEVGGKHIVTDILVEGISLIVSQRADFASVIRQQGGIDGLIALLQQRADANRSR